MEISAIVKVENGNLLVGGAEFSRTKFRLLKSKFEDITFKGIPVNSVEDLCSYAYNLKDEDIEWLNSISEQLNK